jgi:hypothetical protein
MVKCPAHDDGTASLKISEEPGDDGRVLMHCHARCTFESIVDALGIPAASLMGDAPGSSGDGSVSGRPEPKPPTENYDYRDAGGTKTFRVTRYYTRRNGGGWKKQFVQNRFEPDGSVGKGMDGVERVPYRLPDLLSAIGKGETVYVVEGEKDVHTLLDWGLTATTSPAGAGKWPADFGRHFTGADVVILPDADEPGLAHASDVSASVAPHAGSVLTVELPGLSVKGDVTDWARMGNNARDLSDLVDRVRASGPDLATLPDLGHFRRPLVGRAEVSQSAIDMLPGLLNELCRHYAPGIEQTVALAAGLAVLSGVMPNTRVEHFDKQYGLHIMFCLVARSGGGKAILDQCAELARLVAKSVEEDNRRKNEDWHVEKASLTGKDRAQDRMDLGPEPFMASAMIPANASKSYVLKAVQAAGETALMVETEIDTLTSANAQEWGDFTDLVRKAFHHEDYRMGRIGAGSAGESVVIERPSLAIGISGTWGQFEKLFGDNVDNGFFNRFGFLISNASRSYRSPRPTEKSRSRGYWFKNASGRVVDLFDVLSGRDAPLVVSLSDEGWDRVDAMFRPAYDRAADAPMSERALPFVQRSAIVAARIIGVLTVLRAWEFKVPIDNGPGLVATGYDVDLGLHITSVLYDHGSALLSHLTPDGKPDPLVQLTPDAREILDALPDVFKRADADEAGDDQGVSTTTLKRYLKQYQSAGLVVRDGHTYTKVPAVVEAIPFDPKP